MSVCELTDLEVGMCSHCRGLDIRPKRQPREIASTVARYFSRCPSCGDPISEGESLYLIDNEWICGGCAE